MTEDSSTPPATTSSGNQNLIIGLVLGAVVLLLFLLVLQMTGAGQSGPSEVEKLRAERDARKEALDSKIGNPVAGNGQSAQALAARLSSDSAALAGLVSTMQGMLAKAEADLKNATNLNSHLSQQLANSSANATENAQLKSQLADAQARIARSESLVSNLQQQLNNAHTKEEMEAVRAQLESALAARDGYQKQLAELDDRMKNMEASDVAKTLREELAALKEHANTLETENNKLIYEVQKLRAELNRTRLFVEAEALPAKARLLYDELGKLEAATPAELGDEYKRIEQELAASVMESIKFQTGSSNVNQDDVEKIHRKVQASGNDSFFLVVGYASKSGGLDNNKQLSADRATRIASVTDTHKKSEQKVQAVFLSETARFGAELSANQVCEIWEIRK